MFAKTILTYLFLVVTPVLALGQTSFSVESFGREENSVALKSVDRRTDAQGKSCALIKIITLDKNLSVEGEVVGDIVNKLNEYWVYVSTSAQSIKISSPENGSCIVVFADYQTEPLTPALQYSLVLKYPPKVVTKQQEKGFLEWKSLAEGGDPDAQYELAKIYFAGKEVTQDLYEAKRWFAMAADKGHAEAQYRLGNCYARGQGVTEKNYNIAIRYYQMAADQNNADALFALGNCYAKGQGVVQDLEIAHSYYQRAAEQGHQGAMKKMQANL
jgi:hypothetical protein